MTREATILRETAETRIEVTARDVRTWRAASGSSTTCYALLRVTAVSI